MKKEKKKIIIKTKLVYSTACKCYSLNIRHKKVQSQLCELHDPGLQSCARVTFQNQLLSEKNQVWRKHRILMSRNPSKHSQVINSTVLQLNKVF